MHFWQTAHAAHVYSATDGGRASSRDGGRFSMRLQNRDIIAVPPLPRTFHTARSLRLLGVSSIGRICVSE